MAARNKTIFKSAREKTPRPPVSRIEEEDRIPEINAGHAEGRYSRVSAGLVDEKLTRQSETPLYAATGTRS
jgi:hypothetical protein